MNITNITKNKSDFFFKEKDHIQLTLDTSEIVTGTLNNVVYEDETKTTLTGLFLKLDTQYSNLNGSKLFHFSSIERISKILNK
ncbi:hypothetical protein [Bacillus badius]|uniref:hypothetical protein n=1 Tax=Bacillus badius TaxID=1455 RepID=UPI0007B3F799|nr:hypothetical protein [Bacillus badius]KZR59329.1 hypothetical protein A3781_13085 [Bacillus badius]